MSDYPKIFRVRQKKERPQVDDVAGEVERHLASLDLAKKVKPGQSVAITAGSRGIANIHTIIKTVVDHLKRLGLEPFIVPAMGSHGGGTAEGQRRILEGYDITEELIGCPIRATMETVIVCDTPEGIPVHFDRYAYEADHVVVCGRIKPHTKFVGEIESGMMKMMLIGLGKHAGAKIYHRAILDLSFEKIVRSVAGQVMSRCNILAGLGIVENAYDETAEIAAVAPEDLIEREKELLVLAKRWLPRLPFKRVDVLIVDEMGKNISGSGMDTNVVGRKVDNTVPEDERVHVKRIIVRGLTEETHGNACGIGYADFVTSRALQQMDVEATVINCLTGGAPFAAKIPISYDSDRKLLDLALGSVGLTEPPDARISWIRNTLEVTEVECSVAYWDEAQGRDDLEVILEPRDLQFDADDNLISRG